MSESVTENFGYASALERVTRRVLEMKQAGDLEELTELVWKVLAELGFGFAGCAFLLMDEERDWLTSFNI